MTEKIIRERLGEWIYGVDADTLESAALKNLAQKGWRLAVVEAGLGSGIIRQLSRASQEADILGLNIFAGGELISGISSLTELKSATQRVLIKHRVEVGLGTLLSAEREKFEIQVLLISPDGTEHVTPLFGGPPEYAPRWALNHSLNLLRSL